MKFYKIIIKGLVQGIGYRPFIAECAEKVNIRGSVRNTDGIVTVCLSCSSDELEEFMFLIGAKRTDGGYVYDKETKRMPSARVTDIKLMELSEEEAKKQYGFVIPSIIGDDLEFKIIESDKEKKKSIPIIPADYATCDSCREELFSRRNRRYRHPFISCVSCGPRYSIINSLPYDRDDIVMGKFEMCKFCSKEYQAKGNIRRHAQTIACHDCGPSLKLTLISTDAVNRHLRKSDDVLRNAISLIQSGGILAIKDIGGYHLACSPFDRNAVEILRRIKNREGKPFAVMFKTIKQIEEYCEVNNEEAELLNSSARPIVLLKKNLFSEKAFAYEVGKNSPCIGAMLPCNPIQIMLVEEIGPVIMTSANGSGDLLFISDYEMQKWMTEAYDSLYDRDDLEAMKVAIPFGILSHDRDINIPLDDSIVQVIGGRCQTIRRARGYTPEPVDFPLEGKAFAAGGDLKASFCFVEDGKAYMSQHLGDMENEGSFVQYKTEYDRMRKLFSFEPEKFVCDLHPAYRSAALCKELFECEKSYCEDIVTLQDKLSKLKEIQLSHHKAHVAAVIAEHKLSGPVLGFSFDGTGYGEDGSIWGGEVLRWDGRNMERVSSLKPVKLIGGNEGAKNTETILYGYISSFSVESQKIIIDTLKKYNRFNESHFDIINKAFYYGISTVVTSSSMGRAFDAVSALLGICDYNSYEGEAAIELENAAYLSKSEKVFDIDFYKEWNLENIFVEIVGQMEIGVTVSDLARTFINTVADFVCQEIRRNAIGQVALAGGTFCDRILVEKILDNMKDTEFEIYFNEKLSPGDGGLALGQAYLALASEE